MNVVAYIFIFNMKCCLLFYSDYHNKLCSWGCRAVDNHCRGKHCLLAPQKTKGACYN